MKRGQGGRGVDGKEGEEDDPREGDELYDRSGRTKWGWGEGGRKRGKKGWNVLFTQVGGSLLPGVSFL